MMFVHLDTKTGDDCVSIAVTPKMTARELQRKALKKARDANYAGDASRFVLHEARSHPNTVSYSDSIGKSVTACNCHYL